MDQKEKGEERYREAEREREKEEERGQREQLKVIGKVSRISY